MAMGWDGQWLCLPGADAQVGHGRPYLGASISHTAIQSLLRWAGSKRRLVPRLSKFWNSDHERYVEPFAGSACLYFSLEPKRAILGDLNEDLIETYDSIRKDPRSVHAILAGWSESKESYYEIRNDRTTNPNPYYRSAKFIYLNRLCFNGIYRTNLKGEFNVPYGGGRTGKMPSLTSLTEASVLLQGARLVKGDFENVLQQARKGDLVYMDPPYHVESRRVFREYQAGVFGTSDLVRLAGWMRDLDDAGVDFVVSYADSKEGRQLGVGFNSKRVQVRRNVAGFSKHRRTAYEVLISNLPLQ